MCSWPQRLAHAGAGGAGDDRRAADGQREHREHQALEPADRVVGERDVAGGRQQLSLDGQDVDEQDADPERRQGERDAGAGVDDPATAGRRGRRR